jgi:uncharacterized membrane protein
MTGLLYAVTLATALGCALVAGVFFAFSSFVMPALHLLPAQQGIAAMQSINRLAITPVFMAAFVGTGVACVGLAVWALVSWDEPGAAWVIAGSALYVIGTFVLTMVANVPRNDALETLDAASADAAGQWKSYVAEWTAWNHVRGAAALAAATMLIVALTRA